jgi:hypothetical protein
MVEEIAYRLHDSVAYGRSTAMAEQGLSKAVARPWRRLRGPPSGGRGNTAGAELGRCVRMGGTIGGERVGRV